MNTSPVLADVADLSGSDKALVMKAARIPLGLITNVRILSRSEVLSLIRAVIPPAQAIEIAGADFTRISVVRRTPEAAEIAVLLKSHLASVTSWQAEEIGIRSIENLKSISLPPGDVKLRVSSRGVPASFRSVVLSIEATLDGKLLRTFWIKADICVRALVVQVARPVSYRSALAADDVREAYCEIEDPRSHCIRSASAVIGWIAKRALSQGEVLTTQCVDAASLVHTGDTIWLVAQSKGIKVEILVRALQDGKLGDRIKIRNLDSDRALTAVVTGQGEVRITN
jgi:flagellar basal body P-ring formation protein FlgA